MTLLILQGLFLVLSTGVVASKPCPLLGSVFPPPSHVGAEASWQSFASNLSQNLNHYIQAGRTPFGAVVANSTSFSIRVESIDSDQPLFDFHHTATLLTNQTTDANTVYRIGSVSKLLTVYALLVERGYDILNDPISKYVALPQDKAAGALKQLAWDEVTLGALASHLSGVSRDCMYYRSRFFFFINDMMS